MPKRKQSLPKIREVKDLHIPVVASLRRWIRPGWMFFHCPNDARRSPGNAKRLKDMGMLAGVPDLILMPPGRSAPVHFMEFKPSGKLTNAQDNFRIWALCAGCPYVVARTQQEAFQAFAVWDCWVLEEAFANIPRIVFDEEQSENIDGARNR